MRQGSEDRIAAFIVLAAAGASIREAVKLYKFHTGWMIGDHVFPGLVGLGLLIFGVLLFIRPDRHPPEEDGKPIDVSRRRIAAIPAILFGYSVVLPWAGYLIGTFAAAVLLFRALGAYRWWKCLLAALIATACMELIFVQWLHTPLPAGAIIHL